MTQGRSSRLADRAEALPDALAAFERWGEMLEDALPARTLQAIALTVAARTCSGWAREEHEQAARDLGMTAEEIVALQRKRGGMCQTLADEEVAAATLARAVLEDFGHGAGPAFLRVARLTGEPAAVACLMAALRFAAVGAMANAWELRPVAAGER